MTAPNADLPPTAGFDDPVMESQEVFRAVLAAMAQPGRVQDVSPNLDPPAPLGPVAAAVCLTLLDVDTRLWLDPAARGSDGLRRFLAFHCGCPLTEDPAEAGFALIAETGALPALERFNQGSAAYPDRSTTLILQVGDIRAGAGPRLSGPGIANSQRFDAGPLPPGFWSQAAANRARFPRGVDLIFAAPSRLAALPRSTRVEVD